MTIQIAADANLDSSLDVRRRLFLIWRQPSTRRFVRVARLDVMTAGGYRFEYESGVGQLDGFFGLDEYPDTLVPRVVDAMPAFFRNRIMSSERDSYSRYLGWLDLEQIEPATADVPLEILVRSGGGRATDTFHVVEAPVRGNGLFITRFFVSGLSHVEAADQVLTHLSAGDVLVLRDEPDNPSNPLAVALDSVDRLQIGWVPDWLCGELQDLRVSGYSLRAFVERVNLAAPSHVRVLCRVEGQQGSVGL